MEKTNLSLIYGGTSDKKEKPYIVIYIDGIPYKVYINGRKEPLRDK